MDGIDGIAAIEAVFVFGWGGIFFLGHSHAYVWLCWVVYSGSVGISSMELAKS